MAKIKKKNRAKLSTPPSWDTDASSVPIRILMFGNVDKDLRGLKSLNVLSPLTLAIWGNELSNPLITTKKSIQFHGSERYVPWPISSPVPTILMRHSMVKMTVKNGSEYSTILLRQLLFSVSV